MLNLSNHGSPDVVFSYEGPAWSRDGSKLAFQSLRTDAGMQFERDDIFAIAPDGSGLFNITNHPADDMDPQWSPDDMTVAFMSFGRGGGDEIFLVSAQGGAHTNISNSNGLDWCPRWLSSSRILFASERDQFGSGRTDFYSMNSDGSDVVRMTQDLNVSSCPVFSPDGSQVVFTASDGDSEIYVMNANGTNLRKVTDNAAEDAEPGWAGGGRIIFASDLDGDFEIYTIRTTGTDLVKLTDNGWEDRQPRWRPE